MSARILVMVLVFAPAVAVARGGHGGGGHGGGGHGGGGHGGGHGGGYGAFHPVGWNPDLWPEGADLPHQVPKPMEKWDTPVDKTPDWSRAPDWERHEQDAKSWDRTHLPL